MNSIHLETIQWTSLPDVDEVAPIGPQDYAVLEELRAVILRHGYENRFGVALLHRHFDLQEGEVLMERTDVERRTSTLSPEAVHERSKERLIETLWRFGSSAEPDGVTVCVSRCHYDRGHKSRHAIEGR